MVLTTPAIVLSKLRYRDHDLIVKCYTRQQGIMSFLLRGVLKSKKGQTKTAHFQLLSQLQLVVNQNSQRSLHSIREAKVNMVYDSLHSQVFKSAIVMFLAEVLSSVLREEEPNELLFSYIETTLLWLDSHDEYANFHLLFLLKLTKYLGFYPEENTLGHPFFNLQDGVFQRYNQGVYTISGGPVVILNQLMGTTFEDLSQIKITSQQRQSFLNSLLSYYELHLGDFKKPKSLQVLHQVFS